MSKIELNQVEVLRRILTDPVYRPHMINFDMSNFEEVIHSLSEKQYKYIIYLLSVKRWVTIKTILAQCGLKNKLIN